MSLLSRYQELGQSFSPNQVKIRQSLRVNTLKANEHALVATLKRKGVTLERIPFVPHAYWYEAGFSLGATPEYLQGLYYLQETASLLPVLVLDPKPGEVVLDMAAAPGSKTTQAAQIMRDEGVIVALDTEPMRLAALRNNLERLGVASVVAYKKDARFAADVGLQFDKILLDAPCSGNFCVEPDYFAVKSLDGIRQRSRLQKELLKSAYKVLKPGGTLVYSTCSLEPEEDELVIDWFLGKYEDMSLERFELPVGEPALVEVFGQRLSPTISSAWRLWPHKTSTQGFFIAKLHKR